MELALEGNLYSNHNLSEAGREYAVMPEERELLLLKKLLLMNPFQVQMNKYAV